jgi:hypothetical protein
MRIVEVRLHIVKQPMDPLHVILKLRRREELPFVVVVWSQRKGHTPIRHHAGPIVRERSLETSHSFFLVKSVDPGEAAIEPYLRVLVGRADGPTKRAEIIIRLRSRRRRFFYDHDRYQPG